jgi:hypothetical protein
MGYDLPTGKEEIYLIPKRTNACTRTEDGDLPQSYPTLLEGEVLMTPIQLASMMATVA